MTRARDVANVLTAANVLSTDIESAAAISAHTGITDPHPAYLQESTFSANQIVYKNASNEATGSANLTFSGSDLAVAGTIRSTASAGDEGGEIFLKKSVTNTTLTGGVVVDVNQDRLRIFEEGGSNRGYYLDMASGGTGVATNLGSKGMTLINSTSLSGSSVTFSSIPQIYNQLKIYITGVTNATADGKLTFKPNGGTNFRWSGVDFNAVYSGTGSTLQLAANMSRTNADNGFCFTIDNYTAASYTTVFHLDGYYYDGGNPRGINIAGSGVDGPISSFVLANTGGNFAGGNIKLYGVA